MNWLDADELLHAIEEKIGVYIPADIANEFETVRDASNFILSANALPPHEPPIGLSSYYSPTVKNGED